MDIAEIRFLEGPNLFLLQPAVKVEVVANDVERRQLRDRLANSAATGSSDLASAWNGLISELTGLAGQPAPETCVAELDEADHLALVFGWSHRPLARSIVRIVKAVVAGEAVDPVAQSATLRAAAEEPADPPEMIRDGDRSLFSIAVTGTNGKTTTTRLLAHMARSAGKHVGWCSSSGVYVDGRPVEEGDYSGPSGAGQVLAQDGLDLAILETARGGILIKGLGYESNDVSVFTNVSGDHLGLHGVHTVETLARVKSVVCRVTRADGTVVLNADDPLVMDATREIRAGRCLFSRLVDNPEVSAHALAGGETVVFEPSEDAIVARRGAERRLAVSIADIPICFGGSAVHQVENAMAAVGAALAAGLPVDAVRRGLTTFGTEPDHNPGRLNVFDMGHYTVVLDYAHNEAGLERLLAFGRELGQGRGRLVAVIGSAGDRDPALLRALGRIGAEKSDYVIAKGTERYLRGIELDELLGLYREGASTFPNTPYEEVADEWAAVARIRLMAQPGDVFVLMFQEVLGEVEHLLREPEPS